MQEFISNQEMADYLNLALNSAAFRKIIVNCYSCDQAETIFSKLGNALAKYYISTMDNSLEGVEIVCNLFVNEYFNNRFDELFMDLLIDRCVIKEGLDRESLSDRVKIVEQISNRNFQNNFYTHCFPGALYEIISTNGLDISNELFKDELSILERYFKTAYKVGKLCYCELSSASLSYAETNVPERIDFALGGINKSTGTNKYEWYLSSFKNNLSLLLKEGKINSNEFQQLFEAGKRIIDFYCTNQNSCIAVFRKSNSKSQPLKENIFNRIYVDNKIRGTFVGDKFLELIRQCQQEPDKISVILEQGVLELEEISPELKSIFIEMMNQSLRNYLLILGVKNYSYEGFADGYELESGKLPVSEFSIVKCNCPIDLWNMTTTREPLFKQQETKKESDQSLIDIALTSKLLETASKQEQLPERIEQIKFGKYNIPVYFYGNQLQFPNNYLISSRNGTCQISLLSRKVLVNRWVKSFAQTLKGNDQTIIDSIVEKYKMTDIYEQEVELDDVLEWYARELFAAYSVDVQEQLLYQESLKTSIITISFEDDYQITVEEETVTVPRNVLVDMNNEGRYNNLYTSIIEESRKKIK